MDAHFFLKEILFFSYKKINFGKLILYCTITTCIYFLFTILFLWRTMNKFGTIIDEQAYFFSFVPNVYCMQFFMRIQQYTDKLPKKKKKIYLFLTLSIHCIKIYLQYNYEVTVIYLFSRIVNYYYSALNSYYFINIAQ